MIIQHPACCTSGSITGERWWLHTAQKALEGVRDQAGDRQALSSSAIDRWRTGSLAPLLAEDE